MTLTQSKVQALRGSSEISGGRRTKGEEPLAVNFCRHAAPSRRQVSWSVTLPRAVRELFGTRSAWLKNSHFGRFVGLGWSALAIPDSSFFAFGVTPIILLQIFSYSVPDEKDKMQTIPIKIRDPATLYADLNKIYLHWNHISCFRIEIVSFTSQIHLDRTDFLVLASFQNLIEKAENGTLESSGCGSEATPTDKFARGESSTGTAAGELIAFLAGATASGETETLLTGATGGSGSGTDAAYTSSSVILSPLDFCILWCKRRILGPPPATRRILNNLTTTTRKNW